MKWTDETKMAVKDGWNAGRSANAIARELGVTKNAIIGVVHRLGLVSRKSPIKRGTTLRLKKPSAGGARLPADGPQFFANLRRGDCQFAINNETPFIFCAQPCNEGRPYCQKHCEIAYVIKKATDIRITSTNQGWL